MRRKDFFLKDFSLQILTYVFDQLYFTQSLTSFSSTNHILHLCAWLLILFYLTQIDLLINPPANLDVFGDFNVHHKDWLTYSGRTDRPGELCYNFSISNDLLRWLTSLLGPQTVILTVQLFWIYLFLLKLVFVL